MRVLVTGGVRSGKSRHAEQLMAGRGDVVYVAAGPSYDDVDWAARIATHRARRPASWTTVESHDLVAALDTAAPVLVDCLGTWLTAVVDDAARWDDPVDDLQEWIVAQATAATRAVRGDVVWVTNEVGMGVVPEHRSGRVFRDLLGSVNQAVAAACDEVHLVVAGRVLTL